jgi:hypothetical protein
MMLINQGGMLWVGGIDKCLAAVYPEGVETNRDQLKAFVL